MQGTNFILFRNVDNNIIFVISCADQDEYIFNYINLFLLTDITYMYFILKIYIEVYVHVLNVHLTNCLLLWVLLCIIVLYVMVK